VAVDDLHWETRAILEAVGRRLGVRVDDAELLHLHSNVSYRLPQPGWVVRIATNPDALDDIAASVRVTRWLARRDFPCVVPAALPDQPFREAGRVVSVWDYVPTIDASATGADLGRILRQLHDTPTPPEPPATLTDPLASVRRALHQTPEALPPPEREWLADEIVNLGVRWSSLTLPHPPALIHGDAHPGNLLETADGRVLLGDWDHVAIGPREWDLAQIHYTHRRFGRPPADDLAEFADAYGWDIRTWDGLETIVAVREVSGLSAYIRTTPTKPFAREELQRRVRDLREGRESALWRRPPRP
jgi:aminoglycoside phosphotransferase (APT) family kinase protein